MKFKKSILIVIFCAGLGFGLPAFAVRELPKNQPLFLAPPNIKPNYSHNINSPQSQSNLDLRAQTPVNLPEPPESGNPNPSNPGQIVPLSGDTSAPSSSSSYWILLFIGLAGLMTTVVWAYLRFAR
ncbi:MAG TPA: hypothetical protein VF974_02175 [Patescibacteria group bacterium]